MEKTVEEKPKFIKFYPVYIDKTLKQSEGRRVKLDLAVDNVQSHEIYNLALNLNLEAVIEDV